MDIRKKLHKLQRLNEKKHIEKWDEMETVLITKTTDSNSIFIPKDVFINYYFKTTLNVKQAPLKIDKSFLEDCIEQLESIEPLEAIKDHKSINVNQGDLEEIAKEFF